MSRLTRYPVYFPELYFMRRILLVLSKGMFYNIKKEDTLLAAPESMKKKVLSESGMMPDKCVFYGPGETHEQEGLMIETIPAYNKLKPFHSKTKKWLGYIVKMDATELDMFGTLSFVLEK